MSAYGVTLRRFPEPEHRRTLQPVHSGSRLDDGPLNPKVGKGEKLRRLRALEREGKVTREKGRRRGHAGNNGLYGEKIYAYLQDLADWWDGRVCPSVKGIAEAVGCHPATAVRELAKLADRGWIRWRRRCEPTGDSGRRGPQVRQITNWYELLVPSFARELFAKWAQRRGEGGDSAWRQEQAGRAAAREEMDAEEIADFVAGKRASARERQAKAVFAVPGEAAKAAEALRRERDSR